MKNKLLAFVMSALISTSAVSAAVPSKRVQFDDYVSGVVKRVTNTERQWRNGTEPLNNAKAQRIVTKGEKTVGPMAYWGSLYTPEGEEWTYTAEFKEREVGPYQITIDEALITIYDTDLNKYASFTANFELGEHEVTVNSVQVAPQLTRKFFNINDAYEVMVYVHASTEDYTGHSYTQVYTLANGGSLVTTLEGDNIGAVNTATDSWSEKFTMVFMREETILDDYNYEYNIYFDVYSRAGWGGSCNLEHTFAVDYEYIAGSGNYALPILITKHNNEIYFALPRYEKPFFAGDYTSDEVTEDNTFIIDLYDNSFNLVKTTRIPMVTEEGALFSFPGLGELNGFGDLTFGVYDNTENPVYVVGVENYIASDDDFITSLYVYDADGNKIKTLVENAQDYLEMSGVPGFPQQFCFYMDDDEGQHLDMVNVVTGEKEAVIWLDLDGYNLSTNLDRVPVGSSYKYITTFAMGDVDKDNNTIHKFAWFDAYGEFDHYDSINLGQNIALAQPYMNAEAFNPYLFDNTENFEYMFLVKQLDNLESSKSTEYFRIYRDNNDLLLNMGPDEETGYKLNTVFLSNLNTNKPKLVVGYSSDDYEYSLTTISLPFEKFANGSGTISDPYQIATAGDLRAMQSDPTANYVLIADIDMNGNAWAGVNADFTGSLNGNGHTISNLNLTGTGMFKTLSVGATVKDLNIDGVTINSNGTFGILAGFIDGATDTHVTVSNVTISNAKATGSGEVLFGAITGFINLNSVITNCKVVDSKFEFGNGATVGGLVGKMSTFASISNSLFDGNIVAGVAGGIAGTTINGNENITNCHVHGDITANYIAGGIIGESGRTIVTNCYVDGKIQATGTNEAYSGGIVGLLTPTYDTVEAMVIQNCIVAANVSANAEAKKAIAHRIAGFTSGDEMLVDWDSKDPSVNWEDPSTYPYIPGNKEGALASNYALGIDKIDAEMYESDSNPEGQSISMEDLTDKFLADHKWALGTTDKAPWKLAGSGLALHYEVFTLTADVAKVAVSADNNASNPVVVTFTCASRYADYITVKSTNESVVVVADTKVSEDGKSIVCDLVYVGNGNCDIQATLGDEVATCAVATESSSIADVVAAKALTYDGATIKCAGAAISVYNTAGVLVAEGYETVNANALPAGIYVAVSGNETLKIVK